MYARNVKFTTSAADEEILNIAEVQAVLKNMLNCNNDTDYNAIM